MALAGLLGVGQALAASSPPFVDNGNGTVTDTSTGLMWDQCADGLSDGNCATGTAVGYTWVDAMGRAAEKSAANYKGYSDWRLPSIVELKSLVKGTTNPTINTAAFPNTSGLIFWSASTYAPVPSVAWIVYFNDGNTVAFYKTNTFYVRLVRSGQSFDTFALSVDAHGGGAGTVTASGLACARASHVTSGTCARQVANTAYAGQTAQSLTLTATPAVGSVFTGWGGVCSGTSATCTVTMDAAKGVTAEFTPISTSAIVIDPATPSTLYAGLDGAGVYVSTDSGTSWSAATTQPGSLRVKALAKRSGTPLYAATYGGVFKAGASDTAFAACAAQPGNQNVLTLAMHSNGKLYAGTEAGVFVSSDDCANWAALNTGMP